MMKFKVKLVSGFYIIYLWILSKTCKIRIINDGNVDINNSIIGFWHGESYPMYLLLKRWRDLNIAAITTSDGRGDYIETVMKKYGVKPLRLPNGSSARRGISDVIRLGKEDRTVSICFSIDGPLGPFHEPKKMVFYIGNSCNKKYVGIKIHVKGKYTIRRRWDKYVIPLPFSHITYVCNEFGEISKEQLKNYDELSEAIINLMEGN